MMVALRSLMFVALAVIAGLAGADAIGVASARTSCTQTWRVFKVAAPATLSDVDALGPDDVWAVGARDPDGNTDTSWDDAPVVVHWDGAKIGIETLPWKAASFAGVAARSADDIWAVGAVASAPLAAHFDGREWKRVELPALKRARLADVVAIAADDVWAVGTAKSGVVMHWDGQRWQLVDLHGAAPRSELVSVDAVSADDVWAFGYTGPWAGDYGYGPIVLRWDGSRWDAVPSGIGKADFKDWAYGDLDVAPSGEVWMGVGEQSDAGGAPPAFVRWSGPGHEIRTSFRMPYWDDGPNVVGIAAASKDEVWAVGWDPPISNLNAATHSWRRPKLRIGYLNAIVAISPTDIWTVGDHGVLRYHC